MPQAEQEKKQEIKISLRPGMAVEVLNVENRLLFMGRLEGCQGSSVIIRDAKDDELPPILYNAEVRLRFFQNEQNLVLQGKICGSTSQIWKIDRLVSQFTKEQRTYFRQRVSPHSPAMCIKRAAAAGGQEKKPAPCHVQDVSAGGMLILCKEEYRVGDRLSITGIRIVEQEAPFTFNCQVRRVGEMSDGLIRYGCQFESVPAKEQDRLLRAIFAVQREEIKRRKSRGL